MFDSITNNINIIMVFVEGLISFFSPCVIPLLPIYLGYLSGNYEAKEASKKRTLLFTCMFILGIFVALILLNISLSWLQLFFKDGSIWIMRIGGAIIILLGIYQLGLFQIPWLDKTFHLQAKIAGKRMSLALAFVMGFTFSFSWTPCIGPALASILILANSSGSFLMSIVLVSVYAIGFALPFLILSFFSTQASRLIAKHETLMLVIAKVGAIILIVMGLLMVSGNLGALGAVDSTSEQETTEETKEETPVAPSIRLEDQNGVIQDLDDYKGKVVYINFWTTWCPNCKSMIPDLNKLYEKYKDSEDVAVISVAGAGGRELNKGLLDEYITEQGITYPVLYDRDESIFQAYSIRSFPTLFMVDKQGNIYGYLSGAIPIETMEEIITEVLEAP